MNAGRANSIARQWMPLVGFALALAAASAGADSYYCVPLETAVLANRAHVRCAEPIFTRFGYPKDPPGSSNRIAYFAVPLTNRDWANRFIRAADLAHVSGLTIHFQYTSADYSGESFGCDRGDCRTPWAIGLVKAPPPWPTTVVFFSGFETIVSASGPFPDK